MPVCKELAMSHLLKTPGGYYFRIHVPKDLQAKLGKREMKKPLHTLNRLQATHMSATLAIQYHEYFGQLRGDSMSKPLFTRVEFTGGKFKADGSFEFDRYKSDPRYPEAEKMLLEDFMQQMQSKLSRPQPTNSLPTPSPTPEVVAQASAEVTVKPASTSLLFSQAIEKYINEKFILSPDVTEAYKTNVANDLGMLVELIGDVPIEEIDRDKALDVYSKLLKLPANFKRRFPNKTVAELCKSGFEPRSKRTVNATMANASSFFEWLVLRKLTGTDYFAGLRSVDKSKGRCRYSDEELTLIFSHPVFTDHEFNYAYHFFFPLAALLSGTRLNELAQLRLSDVTEEDGIMVLNVTDDEETRAKSEAGVRRVPVHPKLMELGFGEYVKSRKGQHLLFDGLRLDESTGRRSPNASAWYGRFRKAIGLCQRGKDFHSFRHTVVHALIDKEIDERVIKALVGHAEGLSKAVLKSDVTFDIYGKMRFNVNSLHRAICTLNFEDVLGNVVPWNSKVLPIKRISNFAERGKDSHAPAAALKLKIAVDSQLDN
jgi:integrase